MAVVYSQLHNNKIHKIYNSDLVCVESGHGKTHETFLTRYKVRQNNNLVKLNIIF